jgi:selenoprotein W-related protein
MNVSIEYCETCNYRPVAASLAFMLKKELGIDTEFISSKGQVFEVRVDDELIFSKKQLNRFPEHSEIIEILKRKINP